MKRFVFNNLIYKLDNEFYLLVNLISFRRQTVKKDKLMALQAIEEKQNNGEILTTEECEILDELYKSKQILPDVTISEVDNQMKKSSFISFDRFPVKSITFNLTHQCNFQCNYCYQNNYKEVLEFKQLMKKEDIDLICQYLSDDSFNSEILEEIVISGGEPLLVQNIEVINYILNSFSTKKFMLFTNGENIYSFKDKIDFNKIDEYQISLDGPDEIIRSVNKRSGNIFEKVIKGIKHIESLGKKISIVVMWSKELEDYLDKFIFLLKESKILDYDNIKIRFTIAKSYYSVYEVDENIYGLDYLKDLTKRINPKLKEANSHLELFSNLDSLGSIMHRQKNSRIPMRIKRCDMTRSIPMVFEPNGEVFWCVCLGNENGRIGKYKDGIFIDKDKLLKFGNRTIFQIEQCSKCNLKYICSGGCVLPLTSGSYDLYSPACGIFGLTYFWEHLEEFV